MYDLKITSLPPARGHVPDHSPTILLIISKFNRRRYIIVSITCRRIRNMIRFVICIDSLSK